MVTACPFSYFPLPSLYSGYACLSQARGVGRLVVSRGGWGRCREMPSSCLACPKSKIFLKQHSSSLCHNSFYDSPEAPTEANWVLLVLCSTLEGSELSKIEWQAQGQVKLYRADLAGFPPVVWWVLQLMATER